MENNNLKPIAVVALGGNALIKEGEKGNIHEQFANTRKCLNGIVYLIKKGYRIVITHGNGPQVGNELIRMEKSSNEIPSHPLGVIDASTQGWIGYMIVQSLVNRLNKEKMNYEVVAIVTQVVVDPNDPSIHNPTKPVGPFYKEDDLPKLQEKGWTVKEDAGRGFRRIVPSPKPISIIEKKAIKAILDNNGIIIAAGGGGIPVYYEEDGSLEGLDAVIDKDRASSILGIELKAEILIILTSIDKVMLNFKLQNQKPLDLIDDKMAEIYLNRGEFASGSMGPKIEAAINFIRGGGNKVIIAQLDKAVEALEGKSGTTIIKKR